ncbi:FAD-dependent oxidoreductase [Ruania alba]|uniref:Assimilatory nitrate reductase (NADH) beta subunit n=1 Tax=Ruania alba TaxID=648782 RepID=A0A1H5DQB0_9MICO|nr:FAD-dependent oxidoreductase [Ruania alba]SED81017.1 assimilatory nitrate reductase (NADH) beta subunit [Ruania alba]
MNAPRRIVVVGHGMVGSRFADDLIARADPGSVTVQVLGAEEYEPYNRVLLSEVVAGRADLSSLTLPTTASEALQVRRGTTVRSIDLGARQVRIDGGRYPYDHLVLATGSAARVPVIDGLHPDLPAGVHALRTLDDAREIVAATANARRATVIGAGVLGLEAACGLIRRGLEVTVLHTGTGPMDRQLDPSAAAVVTGELRRLGARVITGARTTAVRTQGGHLTGVVARLGEGEEHVPTDLLVLACGTEPETRLARQAGLPVDRGVLVGPDLTSPADPRVHAIGDCAQPPEGGTGLIAQGWDQARRLAEILTGQEHLPPAAWPDGGERPSMALRLSLAVVSRPAPAPEPHQTPVPAAGTDVVRLKAAGLDVVTMGRSDDGSTPGARTVTLSDPDDGRHLAATVCEGVLVAATCVGAADVGADLVASYTRRLPVPADPAHLLLRPLTHAPAPAADPSRMPESTTVCTCNGVSKGDIVSAWGGGARTIEDIARTTRATTGCGGCTDAVCGLAQWLAECEPAASPAVSHGERADGEKAVTAAQRTAHTCEIAAE